ncbi:hypothetical protein [Aeoliella sp.]|uniref:hypothetical protein n=1 Tax=Aeoliella sp. TaxID=2795800 RepID=UPI003CCBDC5D
MRLHHQQNERPKKVIAIASGGGHWLELLRIVPSFEGCDVTYVTVDSKYKPDVKGSRFLTVGDATRWNKLGAVRTALQVLVLLIRVRPDVVVSTGALPGYFAVRLGKLLGARTVWLDSFANAEELSLAGKLAGKCADLWLTQWPELAHVRGLQFKGAVFDFDGPLSIAESNRIDPAETSAVPKLANVVAEKSHVAMDTAS